MNYLTILVITISLITDRCRASTVCDRDLKLSYFNGETYMFAVTRFKSPGKPKDCAELYLLGHHESGVYEVWPVSRLFEKTPLQVYCDMETSEGGWTVIQRRGNFGNPTDYFYKDWNSYKVGFGDRKKEFWLGNDNIYALTNQKLYSVRFDLRDVNVNTAFAQYDDFWIDDENRKYMLHIAGYTGTAGDSMTRIHNNQKFSTKDQENDNEKIENCAEVYKGAWWYNNCHEVNLNGMNVRGKHKDYGIGINWLAWRGRSESLYATEIKIRPKDFKLPLL